MVPAGRFTLGTASTPDIEAHLLPCAIDYTGKASVSRFFHPTTSVDGSPVMRATFRGRQLTGQQVQVGDDAKVVVVQRDLMNTSWKTCGRVNKLVVWSPDDALDVEQHVRETVPSWLTLSKLIHDP